MQEQASTPDEKLRKAKFDRVQQIVAEQQPFIYLINKNALSAISSNLVGASPVALNPQAFWNIETLRLKPSPEMGASK
jgi:peptide/nickel transport system substrate-binding protein